MIKRRINVYNISLIILFLGVLIRFYYQFIDWSFNGDEINLGNNIILKSFNGLLYPLDSGQSAPPLFLWVEKLFLNVGKPFYSLRILTFISSILSLFLFNRIAKKNYSQALYLILIVIFAFNPFILYNSLTLKQYSLDLMMGLLAVNFFLKPRKLIQNYLFFTIWCFISNIGLLFSAAFVFYNVFSFYNIYDKKLIKTKLLQIAPFLSAPILYLFYFFWFMQQSGAKELKAYMVNYWSGSFIPINIGVLKWIAIQGKGIYLFFFSSYAIIGIPMLIIFLFGLLSIFYRIKKEKDSSFIKKIIFIYLIAIAMHLFLSAIKLYPFSDRIYLYMAPLILFVFAEGFQFIINNTLKKLKRKSSQIYTYLLPILLLITYITYLPFQDNHVLGLINYFNNNKSQQIFLTERSNSTISNWIEFTQYPISGQLVENTIVLDTINLDEINSKDLILSRQSHKFGHKEKSSEPEQILQYLISNKKIKTKYKIDGYTLYEVY